MLDVKELVAAYGLTPDRIADAVMRALPGGGVQ